MHKTSGDIGLSAGGTSVGVRHGVRVGVDGVSTMGGSAHGVTVQEKGEELRPAQAVTPAKVGAGVALFFSPRKSIEGCPLFKVWKNTVWPRQQETPSLSKQALNSYRDTMIKQP